MSDSDDEWPGASGGMGPLNWVAIARTIIVYAALITMVILIAWLL